MKTNTIKIVCILFLLNASFVYSQGNNLKPVSTAQDVIDNYMTANAGAENLKKVKSIQMNGNIDYQGTEIPLMLFINSDVFYLNLDSKEIPLTTAYDNTKKKGWNKFGPNIKDMTDKEVERYAQSIDANLWRYYYDKEKYGITHELIQNEDVNGKNCYVVSFKKGDKDITTNYYDTANFNRIKSETPEQSTSFDDFRLVEGSICLSKLSSNLQWLLSHMSSINHLIKNF